MIILGNREIDMKKLAAIGALLAIAGCATTPAGRVKPAQIDSSGYPNLSCEELAVQMRKRANEVLVLNAQVNDAAQKDAESVSGNGTSAGSRLSGKEAELAIAKGHLKAIIEVDRYRCGWTPSVRFRRTLYSPS